MQETELFEDSPEEAIDLGARQIWAVGGGKGGVGKSFVTANLAVGLAQRGFQVVVVDADLGGANMHTCLGIDHPPYTLADFVDNRVSSLEEIILATEVPRLKLISGASDILSLANPQYSQKQKMLRHLKRLNADYILLDLGAGTTYNVLDFFNLAHTRLVVVTPEPTSIQNGYGFVKSALYRHLQRQFSTQPVVTDMLKGAGRFADEDAPRTIRQMTDVLMREMPEVGRKFQEAVTAYKLKLVLNMTGSEQADTTFRTVRTVCRGFLNLDLELMGSVERDEKVLRSVEISRPVLLSAPESEAARKVRGVLDKLLKS